jgi:hypothetical protein
LRSFSPGQRRQLRVGGQRLDQVRGDDHQQFALFAVDRRMAEKRAEIGRSPSPGSLSTCEVLLVLIKPLMTKLSPSAREMLVSVRRTVRPAPGAGDGHALL